MNVCVCTNICRMCVGIHGNQEGNSDPLELGLQVVVSTRNRTQVPLEEPQVLLTTKPSLYTDFPVQCRSALASENILTKQASNHPQYL